MILYINHYLMAMNIIERMFFCMGIWCNQIIDDLKTMVEVRRWRWINLGLAFILCFGSLKVTEDNGVIGSVGPGPGGITTCLDWWLTYPSEKYESQLGWWFPRNGKNMFQTTNQIHVVIDVHTSENIHAQVVLYLWDPQAGDSLLITWTRRKAPIETRYSNPAGKPAVLMGTTTTSILCLHCKWMNMRKWKLN